MLSLTDLKLPLMPIEKWSTYRPIYSNKLLICRKSRFLGRVKRIAIKPALSFVQMKMCCVSLRVDNDRHRLVRTGQLPSPCFAVTKISVLRFSEYGVFQERGIFRRKIRKILGVFIERNQLQIAKKPTNSVLLRLCHF